MNKKKVVFLNLFKISFPLTAIGSIGHRISGFFLFLTIPALLCALYFSYSSEENFNFIASSIADYFWLICLVILAFVYHLCAGVRHLLMDIGIGDKSFQMAKTSALVMMIASVLIFIFIIFV